MTTIEIKSVAEADGKQGPQWQLEVLYPWTQYAAKTWVEQEDFPSIKAGMYEAVVEKKNQKSNTDGSQPFHWNYRILELKPVSATAPQESGYKQAVERGQYQRSKEEMRWTEAMHMATRMCPIEEEDSGRLTSDALLQWATWFYNRLDQDVPQRSPEPDSGTITDGGDHPDHGMPEDPPFPEEVPDGHRYCPVHQQSQLGPDGTHLITDNGQRVVCRRGE